MFLSIVNEIMDLLSFLTPCHIMLWYVILLAKSYLQQLKSQS